MPDSTKGDLQKYRPQEIQRERLEELVDYRFGQKGKIHDEKVITDFNFLCSFLPEHLLKKTADYLSRANHSQVVEALIDLLEQEVGESPVAHVVEFQVREGIAEQDFSNLKLYRELLNKFREMQKSYSWTP